MGIEKGQRNHAQQIELCPSLWLRYTVSVTKAPKEKYKEGYYNAARFYLYSPRLKKEVGKSWQMHFAITKKAAQKAKGERPKISGLNENQILTAITKILILNADINPVQKKMRGKKTATTVVLNQDELFVYWLTHFKDIYALDSSIRTPEDFHKTMAKLCREIGSYDLNSLCTVNQHELYAACRELSNRIKKALRHDSEAKTSNIKDKTKIVRFLVEVYLREKGIDPTSALEILIKESTPKKGAQAKISNAMRLQSIAIGRYRSLWERLTEKHDPKSIALLLMIFLGLTSEEVCGLQKQDQLVIAGYQRYSQFRVVHRYKKGEDGQYQLIEEGDFRNIPIPRPIQKQVSAYLKEPETKKYEHASDFLLTKDCEPLKPEPLMKDLSSLLKNEPNQLTITDRHKKTRTVDIAFQARSYRVSCRYYWQYHCGMTQGEICYLGALTPPDTAAAHYIDFNNSTMQYRMLKQLEYGLALFANEGKAVPRCREWTRMDKKAYVHIGGLDTRAHMEVHVQQPVELKLSSNRGLLVYKEV